MIHIIHHFISNHLLWTDFDYLEEVVMIAPLHGIFLIENLQQSNIVSKFRRHWKQDLHATLYAGQ